MKKNILSMAALLMASATVFTACSNDDNIISEQPAVNSQQTYTMTVEASKGGDDATTRALTLSGKTLSATWAVGEKVAVYNVTKSAALEGYLEAQSAGASTTLKGTLTGTISAGDELRLSFLKPVYSGQNGTLAQIASNCDYAEATVTVATVNGSDITTNAANFANQQAIVKFTLKDQSDNLLNASSLTISAASNKLVKGIGNYTKSTTHSGYTWDSGTDGHAASSNLVDGSTGTKWCAGGEHKSDGVWYCEFHTESAVQVDGYTLTTGDDNEAWNGRNPKDWVLKAKVNSGDAWTTIATVANESTMEDINFKPYDFIVDNPGTYKYFRIEISSVRSGGTMQLSELQLWKGSYGVAYGPLTVIPASATSEMTVALRNENAGSDTYTLTANVGGQNYTFEKSGVTFENGKYYEITVKMLSIITLTPGQIGDLYGDYNESKNVNGITIEVSGGAHFYTTSVMDVHGDLGPNPESAAPVEGSFTFTSSAGKIKRIEINHNGGSWNGAGAGWPGSYNVYGNSTFTWSGTPAESVTLNGSYDWEHNCSLYDVSSIVFTLGK